MKSTLCFALIIILLLSPSLVSSQSVFPDHHFINSGSNSNILFNGKTFNGDVNPVNFLVSGGRTVTNTNNQVSELYKTARVFNTKSWYNLEADDINTFVMVRLHFFPFSYSEFDLSNSKFNVSVNGFNVLPGVNVVKEVIIPIGSDRKVSIEFNPFNESSPAFVNAVEAFTTPHELFEHYADELNNTSTSYAFSLIHRINVGGQRVEINHDTLGRIWTPDDPFIISSLPATNRSGTVIYAENGASKFHAPIDVYGTAKVLTNKSVNITWSFNVSKSSQYLVRAHFCDFISIGLGSPNDAFNFFIDSRLKKMIPPDDRMWELQVPFYVDFNFTVESDESKFVNVSIGAISGNKHEVFLNGLEIMELLYSSGRVDGKNGKKVMPIVVGCVIGGVVLVLVLLVGFFIGSKYGRAKRAVVGAKPESNVVPSNGRSSYTGINLEFTVSHPSPIPSLNLNLRFPLADILLATNNFDEKLMIGKGGFGKVYKGILYNDVIVAVKRGEKGHGQGRPEFVTEIMVLSKIRHQHLVTLIGYCDEKSEMILVFEYMEKGTLQDHLYDVKDNPKLSWSRRLEICISATRGLHYLHTGSDAGIIHRDVKSTNILLNEKYVAKVADFGISRLDNVDEGDITDIKGSFGYLDPEYIRYMKLTQKSDVYSFGVVLLEVLCARPALDNTLPPKEANLADWAIRNIKNGMAEEIIDPFLVDTISPNSLRKFLETVERCLKDTGDERPSMIDVLWDLEYTLKLQQMVVDKEPYDDSTMNTSLQLPILNLHRLPFNINDDDSEVNHSSVTSYPSESHVFSQLKIDEAR